MQILARRLKLGTQSAERSYRELLGQSALARKGALDIEGLRTVLNLRAKFAPSPPPSADPAAYYDLSYYQRAIAQ